jgi:hypothetical protein
MPLSNCDVCARASAAFVLPVPVWFAFAFLSFLYYSFASTTVIFYAYYNLNFLIYFLLRIEDYVKVGAIKVGAIKVGIVIGT